MKTVGVGAILDSAEEDVAIVLLAEVLLRTGGVKVDVRTELEDRSGGGEDELEASCVDEDVGDGLDDGVGVGVSVGVGCRVEIGVT